MRALLVLALCSAGCASLSDKPELTSPNSAKVKFGTRPVELTLARYPGLEPFKLESLRGRVVLLDVWATWCDPCRESLPLYEDFGKEFGARGFEVVALATDDDPAVIAPFLVEAKVQLPVVVDPKPKSAMALLGVSVMPTAYLIDRRGVIREVHEGFDEDMLSTWLQEIELLVAEPAP
ncbi:MAG: TlpA disulfide reductase family protein [Myxococcaceae bacterium]